MKFSWTLVLSFSSLTTASHMTANGLSGLKTRLTWPVATYPCGTRANHTNRSRTLSSLLLFSLALHITVLHPWLVAHSLAPLFSPWFLLLLLNLPLAVQSPSGICSLSFFTVTTSISQALAFHDFSRSWLRMILTRSCIYQTKCEVEQILWWQCQCKSTFNFQVTAVVCQTLMPSVNVAYSCRFCLILGIWGLKKEVFKQPCNI